RKERVGRILQMHANHREDKEAAFTGDIVALVGLKHAKTGDTLSDPAHPVVLESMTFPVPVVSVAIEPKTKADQDKLTNALAKLADEDPTFLVKFNEETGQTLISGMGELHLQIIVDRLKREFNVRATLVDGSFHEVDSSEIAFKLAGQMALREGARKADPALLEPIMAFEIVTPEEFMGEVMGDITSRRGKIEHIEERTGTRAIRVHVPLAELFGYATDLRSKTQGRANHSPMQLDTYQEVPAQIAKEIVARVRGE